MKYIRLCMILSLFFMQGTLKTEIYLWESYTDDEKSCCLHIRGVDVCNPHIACTRFVTKDLSGILDYVVRLLATDKAQVQPHNTILLYVKRYVRMALQSQSYFMEYHFDRHGSVKFYHQILESVTKSKDGKLPALQSKSKSKKDEYLQSYLVKLGLMTLRHK